MTPVELIAGVLEMQGEGVQPAQLSVNPDDLVTITVYLNGTAKVVSWATQSTATMLPAAPPA